ERLVTVPAGLRKTRADGPAGGRVPELGVPRGIPPSREAEEDVAVGAQSMDEIRAGDLPDLTDRLSRVGIPEPHGTIETAGQDGLAVGAERHGGDPPLMPQEPDQLARGGVPEPRVLVLASREDGLAVGAEGHAPHLALVPHGRSQGLASRRVPE